MTLKIVGIAGWFLAASAPAFAASTALPLPEGCEVAGSGTDSSAASAPDAPSFPPVQLQIRTPFEPTVFPAGGYNYLLYELHLQNFTDGPLALRGLEVFDADRRKPIASLVGQRLFEKLVPIGADVLDSDDPLVAGRLAVAFICLAFDSRSAPPAKLSHRVLLAGSVADGPTIGTRNGKPKVLAPPVSGTDWMAVSSLSKGSHHRSGLFVAGGLAQISRRYAVDWKREQKGAFFSGDARNVRSYHSYGQDVLAVADAMVVVAKNGFPDNIPRTAAGFATAVPVTMETVAGNSVVLDLGDGQFAYYAHLKPGSVRVKVGDRVLRGQSLALVGNSGDAREPHLHFQVTTSPEILASEGLPYVIDRFRVKAADGSSQDRVREFPLSNAVIDFGAGEALADQRP
ncbi:MAG: M23 family metallopeptidase [Sphingomonas bacterium]|nr:M23 family metallopeptidase [Sphingomonas bacterium]